MACLEQLFPQEELEPLQFLPICPQQPCQLAWLRPLPQLFSQFSLLSQLQAWLEVLLLLPPQAFIELCLLIWLKPSHSSYQILSQALKLRLFEEQRTQKPYPLEKISYHSFQQLFRSSFRVQLQQVFHFSKPSCQSSLQLPTWVRIWSSHSSHLLLRFSWHSLVLGLLWWICPSYRLLYPPSFRLLQPSQLILLVFYLCFAQLQPSHYLPSSDSLSLVRLPPSFHSTFPELSPSDPFPSCPNFSPSPHSSSPPSFPLSSHRSSPPQHPLPSFSPLCLPFPLLTPKVSRMPRGLRVHCWLLCLNQQLYSQNRQGQW